MYFPCVKGAQANNLPRNLLRVRAVVFLKNINLVTSCAVHAQSQRFNKTYAKLALFVGITGWVSGCDSIVLKLYVT